MCGVLSFMYEANIESKILTIGLKSKATNYNKGSLLVKFYWYIILLLQDNR